MKLKMIINFKMSYINEREMNMKKKLTLLLALVIAVSSFAVGVMGKGLIEKIEAELRGDFEIVVDGKKEVFKNAQGEVVYPILYEGTTYLPVRAIGELMGKTVYWYQDEKRIELVNPGKEEVLVTDADVIVDGADKVKPEKAEKVEKAEKAEKAEKVEKLKDAEVKITLEKAKRIALDKAGVKEKDVVFEEAKLDRDDTRVVYDIEFRHGLIEYSFEIDAENGKILEWEKDVD